MNLLEQRNMSEKDRLEVPFCGNNNDNNNNKF